MARGDYPYRPYLTDLTEEELLNQEMEKLGPLESLLTIGSSGLSTVPAGIAGPAMGLWNWARGNDHSAEALRRASVQGIEDVMAAGTYQPRTQSGQVTNAAIQSVLAPFGEKLSDVLYEGAADKYGEGNKLGMGTAAVGLGVINLAADRIPGPANPFKHKLPTVIRERYPSPDVPTQGLLLPDPVTGQLEEPAYVPAPPSAFTSRLRAAIPSLPAKATGAEYRALLTNPQKFGVKADEIKYTRLDQLLGRPGVITRAEIQDFMDSEGGEFDVQLTRRADPETGFDPQVDTVAAAARERDWRGKKQAYDALMDSHAGEFKQMNADLVLGITDADAFKNPYRMRSAIRRAGLDKNPDGSESDVWRRVLAMENEQDNASSAVHAARMTLDEMYKESSPIHGMMQLQDGPSGMLDADGDPIPADKTYMESVLHVPTSYTETGATGRYHSFPENPLVFVRSTRRPLLDRDGGQIGTMRLAEQIQSDTHQLARRRAQPEDPKPGYYPTQPRPVPKEVAEARQQAEIEADAANVRAVMAADAHNEVLDEIRAHVRLDPSLAYMNTNPASSRWLEAAKASQAYTPELEGLLQRFNVVAQEYNDAKWARANANDKLSLAYSEASKYTDPKSSAHRWAQPDLPFQDAEEWAGLGIKQLIADAIEAGDDAIAIPSGRYAAKGQDQLHFVENLRYDGRHFTDEYGQTFEPKGVMKTPWLSEQKKKELQAAQDNFMDDDDIITMIGDEARQNVYTEELWEVEDPHRGTYHFFRTEDEAKVWLDANGFEGKPNSGWAIMDPDMQLGDIASHEGTVDGISDLTASDGLLGKGSAKRKLDSAIHDWASDAFNNDVDYYRHHYGSPEVSLHEEVIGEEGAAGVAEFYDTTGPRALKKVLKKIDPNAKIEYSPFSTNDFDDQFITVRITDKMREQYQKRGFDLFTHPLTGAAAAGGGYLMMREEGNEEKRRRRGTLEPDA